MASTTDLVDENTPTLIEEIFIEAIRWVSIYFSLLLILTGCVCNPLSFIVFSRRTYRYNSISVYLRFLSLTDLGVILTGFTRLFIIQAFHIDVRVDDVSCKIYSFLMAVFVFSSSWTLVVVTTERLVSIVRPHQVHVLCSRVTVTVVCVLVVLVNGVVRLPFMFYFDTVVIFDRATNGTLTRVCVFSQNDPTALQIMGTVAVIHTTCLPVLIIGVFNVLIVRAVIASRKRVQKVTNPKKSNISTSTAHGLALDAPESDNVSSETDKSNFKDNEESVSGRVLEKNKFSKWFSTMKGLSRQEMSLTITLLIVTTTFITCNLPNTVYGPMRLFQEQRSSGKMANAVNNVLDMLMFTNSSINFCLYCITGSRFRNEVRAMFKEINVCRQYTGQ